VDSFRSEHRGRYDAVVIGGGHNGLVAAFYLARAGKSVAVVERRPIVGGLAAPLEVFPGFRGAITNTPSGLSPRVAADMALGEFGLVYDRPDPTMIFPFDDGRAFRGWRRPDDVVSEVKRFSEHDAVAYFEVIEYFARLARKLDVSVLEEPPSLAALVARLQTPEDEAAFAEVMFGSIRDFLDQRLESWEIKALLASLAMSAGNVGPSTPGSPIGLLRRPLNTSTRGALAGDVSTKYVHGGSTGLPRGGMGSVGEAMARAAQAAGVTIMTESPVREIMLDGRGAAYGVILEDGRELAADAVLSNLHPRTTLLDLAASADLPGDVAASLRRRRVDGGAFKLFLALDDIPRLAAAAPGEEDMYASCQYRYSPSMDYLDEAFDDFRYGRWSRQPKMLGLTPTVHDPSLAPPGKHLMSVSVWFAPYHLREGSWEEQRDLFARRCVAAMERFIPNISSIVTDVRAFAPTDFEREYGLVEGHQLHGDMTPGGMFGFRPHPSLSSYRTPVPGLYLCGSAAWPGGTVTGLPGRNAALAVLRDAETRDPFAADPLEIAKGY
jgi:phytoene dehydrogenase-like protein